MVLDDSYIHPIASVFSVHPKKQLKGLREIRSRCDLRNEMESTEMLFNILLRMAKKELRGLIESAPNY